MPFLVGKEEDVAVFKNAAVDDDLFFFEELAGVGREGKFLHAGEGVGGTSFHGAEDRYVIDFESDVGKGLDKGERCPFELQVEWDKLGCVFFSQSGKLFR